MKIAVKLGMFVAALLMSVAAFAGQINTGEACGLTDITWGDNPTVDATACFGSFPGENDWNSTFAMDLMSMAWGSFDQLVKSNDGAESGTIDGVEFTLDWTGDTAGTWDLSWQDVSSGAGGLPITLDIVAAVKAGDEYSLYLFDALSFYTTPSEGVGAYTVSFLNRGGNTPDLSHLSLYARISDTLTPVYEVPEPASAMLFGLGLLGLIGARRKVAKAR